MQRRSFLQGVVGASCVCSLPAWAQKYPSQPVKIIVPYAPGGGVDSVARWMAQGLTEELGQSFIVDNRAGAGGMIGADAVARATPDGYTLLFGSTPELTVAPHLQQRPPYSALDDFLPIAMVSETPNLIVANAQLGATTLRGALEAAAKKSGGSITIGTAGNGSVQHIAVELLRSQTGMNIVHVPYKGAAPAALAVLSGETSFALVGAPPLMPHIKSGKLVALAVTQTKRSQLVPDVPTVAESIGKMKEQELVGWNGLLAPSRTPQNVSNQLEKAAFAVLKRPAARIVLAAMGAELIALPPSQFANRLRTESKLYSETIKRFAIKAN
jgi:tripartite-type tricarboxylate transporter receptor subunit TctC